MSKKNRVGKPDLPAANKGGRFVQTERVAHEEWGRLSVQHPKASALLHFLVARMDTGTNAVVASHAVLAGIMGVTTRSIKTYLNVLAENNWIQIVALGKGTANAYVVNSYVAWAKDREKLKYATFSAAVIADRDDQSELTLETTDLRSIPTIYDGEWQLPQGQGAAPPAQPSFDGLEPPLPAIRGGESDE